jgi:uncharacterized integral membrane protein
VRLLVWLFRAFVFFTLFAFALNNQQSTTVHWFFGAEWRAPLVIVVLVAFAAGCAIGVLAMVPAWWRHRRIAKRHAPPVAAKAVAPPTTQMPSGFGALDAVQTHPPRDGL